VPRSRNRAWRLVTRGLLVAGSLVLVLVLAALALALWPLQDEDLKAADPDPSLSYRQAVQQFDDWAADEDELGVFAPCRSGLYTTGEPTAVSVVLLHGLTNCPRQFEEIATDLVDSGFNVVVLRAPYHGIAAPGGGAIGDVSEVSDLTAEDLALWTDVSIDIASGLGGRVRVLGLSMGGTAAAWAAQFREVDRVVTVAPALSLARLPGFANDGFTNLFVRLPAIPVRVTGDLDHSYPGENSRAAAEMLLLARAVREEAAAKSPATQDITVVTNAADEQVRNDDIADLADSWTAGGADVRTVTFPASLGLVHDVVDAQQPKARTDVTWPLMIAALVDPESRDLQVLAQ
jgi:alpha-beta hydrolase superfamily lysophospholipase